MTRTEHDRARVERQLQYVATLLQAGELVLWSGRPSARVVVMRVLPQTVFGIVFVCVLVLTVGMPVRRVSTLGSSQPEPSSVVAPWISLPILLMMGAVVTLLLIAGIVTSLAVLTARRGALRTLYVLTDHRALVIRENPFGQECVREFRLDDPERVVAFHPEGGVSTIAFDRSHALLIWGMQFPVASDWYCEGFVGIGDGVEVEKLVRNPALRAAARNRVGTWSASDQRVEKGPLSA